MIDPKRMLNALRASGVRLFTGVPDSLLKHFCAYVDDNAPNGEHIIAANEGNAVAIAAGHYLTTGTLSVVYMQNSGLGNAVNPLTSLTDSEVYRIPMLMVIGWRGEPGVKDEPQHVKQGKITEQQLKLLGIEYRILDHDSDCESLIDELSEVAVKTSTPVALLVRKNAFSEYKTAPKEYVNSTLNREDALNILLDIIGNNLIISTTGKTSREIFELRKSRGEEQRDFLTVGSMGHTSSLALGAALGAPSRQVFCIDGDGSMIMHMGAVPIIGAQKPKNLVHVLLNNAAHESVGGQPTVGDSFDFEALAKASGYSAYEVASNASEIGLAWSRLQATSGPVMLEVRISIGSRPDLGRPTSTAEQNKLAFMAFADAK